jgi:hypothetical protein
MTEPRRPFAWREVGFEVAVEPPYSGMARSTGPGRDWF